MSRNKRFETCLSHYETSVKADILKALREGEPLTITAIAARTNLTWKIAQRRLLGLVEEGCVVMRKIEGSAKLFSLNPEFDKEEREP